MDVSKKFGERLRCLSIQLSNFHVTPDLSDEPPASRNSRSDSREPHQTYPVVAPDLSDLRISF
jgi:hypothetical protein